MKPTGKKPGEAKQDKKALNSKLFVTLRENGHLLEDHAGGCVLYEERDLVERILAEESN